MLNKVSCHVERSTRLFQRPTTPIRVLCYTNTGPMLLQYWFYATAFSQIEQFLDEFSNNIWLARVTIPNPMGNNLS